MISTSDIHPMIVHFPIALLLLGFIADLASVYIKKEVCLSKLGLYLLLIGTLSAIPTLLSGLLFTSALSGEAGQLKETHELFAIITTCLAIVTSVLRIYLQSREKSNSMLKLTTLIMYALTAVSVSITGYFGGTLVYKYMMPL